MTCQLSDPCLGGEHNCRAPQACVATGGSNFKCICMGGYFPPADAPETCIDLDECTMGMHKCAENEDCVNNIGGYDCNCKEGAFKQSGVCRERDECSLGLHNCDENASCLVNTHFSSLSPRRVCSIHTCLCLRFNFLE